MGAADLRPSTSSNVLLPAVKAKAAGQQKPANAENHRRFADALSDAREQNRKESVRNQPKRQSINSQRQETVKNTEPRHPAATKSTAAKKATANNQTQSFSDSESSQINQYVKKNRTDNFQATNETALTTDADKSVPQNSDELSENTVNGSEFSSSLSAESSDNSEAALQDASLEANTANNTADNNAMLLAIGGKQILPDLSKTIGDGELAQDSATDEWIENTSPLTIQVFSDQQIADPIISRSPKDLPGVFDEDGVKSEDDAEGTSSIDLSSLTAGLTENSAAQLSESQTVAPSLSQSIPTPMQASLGDASKTALDPEATSTNLDVAIKPASDTNISNKLEATTLLFDVNEEATNIDLVSSNGLKSPLDTNAANQALRSLIAAAQSSKTPEQTLDLSTQKLPESSTAFGSLLSGLAGAAPTEIAQANRGFVPQTALSTPLGQPQWSEQVGEKVLWMASQKLHSAEIRLDPPELGPLQVKVVVAQDQTHVSFTSHHAQVRDVLDQNLPRLREMFSEQGMNLVNVDVSDRSFQRQQQGESQHDGRSQTNEIEDEEPVVQQTAMSMRLVDHYA